MRIHIALMVLAGCFCGQAFAAEAGKFYTDGPRGKKAIALTFDDGPGLFTQKILDVLDKHKVKATFFMNGDQVAIRPDLAKEVQKRGHEVGDHTWSHMNFFAYEKKNGAEKTKTMVRDEMRRSNEMIAKILGTSPRLCRMPNGYSRAWVSGIGKDFGYALVNWTFGEDWLKIPEDRMAAEYLSKVKPGAILLFHDGGKNREKTVNILPGIIEKARAGGLEILTVGELLN